jgi:hypothetical protein
MATFSRSGLLLRTRYAPWSSLRAASLAYLPRDGPVHSKFNTLADTYDYSVKHGPAYGLELVPLDETNPHRSMAASFLSSSSRFGDTATLDDIGAGQETCFRLVEIKA